MESFERLCRERLRNAALEGDVVMDYVYDKPMREGDLGSIVALARDIALERLSLDVDDDEARIQITRGNEAFAVFSSTHPQTFRMMTTKAVAAERYSFLRELAFVRGQVERGLSPDDANVHVRDLIAGRCKERQGAEPPPSDGGQ